MKIGPNLKKNLGVLSGREKTLITFLAIFVSVLAIVFPIIISGSTLYRITTLEDYKVGQLADETIFSPVNFSWNQLIEIMTTHDQQGFFLIPYL